MAFANSAITDIIATTIQSRSGELADNLTQNNANKKQSKEAKKETKKKTDNRYYIQ